MDFHLDPQLLWLSLPRRPTPPPRSSCCRSQIPPPPSEVTPLLLVMPGSQLPRFSLLEAVAPSTGGEHAPSIFLFVFFFPVFPSTHTSSCSAPAPGAQRIFGKPRTLEKSQRRGKTRQRNPPEQPSHLHGLYSSVRLPGHLRIATGC